MVSPLSFTTVSAGSTNASTLDNLDSTQFLRSDAADTATGLLDLNGGVRFVTTNAGGNGISFVDDGFQTRWDGRDSLTNQTVVHKFSRQGYNTGNFNAYVENWYDSAAYHSIGLNTSGVLQYDSNTVWHAGNDGAGSGLDADTVDGIQALSFLRSDTNDSVGTDVRHDYGPNSTWSSTLRVGGNGYTAGQNNAFASVVTTNGNLHLDAGGNRGLYLNHYAGTAGVAFGSGASGAGGLVVPRSAFGASVADGCCCTAACRALPGVLSRSGGSHSRACLE